MNTALTQTTKGLRDILFDELKELRTKKGNPTKSREVANLAKQIISTARLEIEYSEKLQKAEQAKNIKTAHVVSVRAKRTAA
jgi:hypothetical protein